MKIAILSLIGLMYSGSVIAAANTYPKVGTTCTYQGQAKFNEEYESIIIKLTLRSIDSNGVGEIKGFLESKSNHNNIQVSMGVPSVEQIDSIVKNCESQGGTRESKQVLAGTFDSCKLYQQGHGYNWIAQVPFGSIRVELDSRPMQYELKSCIQP